MSENETAGNGAAHGQRRERPIAIALGAVLVLVAALVGVFVGRGDQDDQATVGTGSQTVRVEMANMRYSPSVIEVARGTDLTLLLHNVDDMPHDLYVDGVGQTPLLQPGEKARLQVGVVTQDLSGWCTVPGHKAAGMTMSIRLTGAGAHQGAMNHSGQSSMPAGKSGKSATIDFNASPPPDWKPYDPVLAPAPSGKVHRVTFTIRDTDVEVAPGVKQTLWTYNGTAPGPILRGHVGDRFIVTIVNHGDMVHSIDFHAGNVSPDTAMRAIPPGKSLRYAFTARYSGAWLYHCSTMPMSLHIANGMFGAVIIDPPGLDRVSKEFVMVQSELYLGPQNGVASESKINARKPDAVVFNGYVNQYADAPIKVRVGERIRVWVIDAGPQFGTSFHVVGTQFDTVFKEGRYLLRPDNPLHGAAQTLDLAPAQGGFVEFTLPAPGHYTFLDHAMLFGEHGARGIFLATE